ncbi:MAG: Thiol-disulfide isomerase or thioredoxin [Chitinophagaceae bacterium]|nr:Thiol-disulfide isomerase or thioredoxin [Chitinophagaceae bacterium]
MKILRIIQHHIFLLLILILPGFLNPVTAAKIKPKYFVIVTVILKDSDQTHLKKIEISVPENEVNSIIGPTVTYSFDLKKTFNSFRIPLPTKISYARIRGLNEKQRSVPQLETSRNLFLVKNRDSINIEYSNDKENLEFLGKNAVNYSCQYKLNCNSDINRKSFNYYCNLKEFDSAFTSLIYQRDSLNRLQSSLIHQFGQKLDPICRNLLEIDFRANTERMILAFCNNAFLVKATEQYPAAKRFYNKYFGQKTNYIVSSPLLLTSYQYCDYLLFKEITGILAVKSTPEKSFINDFKFSFINGAIDRDYPKSKLRDKLKFLAFCNVDQHQDDFADFLDGAINDAQQGPIRNSLTEIRRLKGKGAKIENFQFADENGRPVTLQTLKGRLVVLDFWFTGCHGCLGMAKTLKPLVMEFQDNPKIAFVSLCIDRNKEMWKRSLQSEMYSSQGELNLFEGMNGQSRFVRTYNIQEYPTLFLISKNGELITSSPPDPRFKMDSFIKLLKENL